MNRRYMRLSWFCAQPVLLSACQDGLDALQGGIEGSGITTSPVAITTSGVVTALGSIVVNDVEYDLAGATITINGLPGLESDLAPGQVTIVEGELGANGTQGIANRVTVETPVAGPVSAVDVALSRLTILGQTIAIDTSTIIEDGTEGSPLGGIELGRDVEVAGFADSSGVLHARRIEARATSTPLLVTGHVANLDTSTGTFSINGQAVSYATATLRGFESPAEGAVVRVAARDLHQGTLVADDVSLREARLPGKPGDAAGLQGWVTRFSSVNDFDVDGRPVVGIESSEEELSVVRLDAFVSVRGVLIADGVVRATGVKAVLPGRLVGGVTIDGVSYGISGLMTGDGDFRLNIEAPSGGPPVLDSGLGQLVGTFTFAGSNAMGTGVLIGEACALPSAGRFCGAESEVRIELTRTSSLIDDGSSGVIRVATASGEETWNLNIGYWGGRAGFDPSFFAQLAALYELHQAELIQGGSVLMSVDGEGRLFFQSAETGCIGNGVVSNHLNQRANLYDVKLTLEACTGSFAYLNADFEGLSTLESLTPWDYDFSVLSMWVSTPAGAVSPAAISLWGRALN